MIYFSIHYLIYHQFVQNSAMEEEWYVLVILNPKIWCVSWIIFKTWTRSEVSYIFIKILWKLKLLVWLRGEIVGLGGRFSREAIWRRWEAAGGVRGPGDPAKNWLYQDVTLLSMSQFLSLWKGDPDSHSACHLGDGGMVTNRDVEASPVTHFFAS